MTFAGNMGKNLGKYICKNLSGKYSQKLLIMLNNLQQMHLKLLQKTAEATGDLIGNKAADKITKI